MNVEKAWESDKHLRTITGLARPAAEQLLEDFIVEVKKDRPEKRGPEGRPRALSDKECFVLFMMHIRHYDTIEKLALIFDIGNATVDRTIKEAEEAIRRILQNKGHIPLNAQTSSEEFTEKLKTLKKIYVDGTEQPIRRPKDSVRQRICYSGKKKRHTKKIVIITDESKKIVASTAFYPGSCHDFAVFKEEEIEKKLPAKTPVYVDTGFQGLKSLREDLNIRMPKKKPQGRNLNGGEKLGNRLISRERVKVEHAIGGSKKYQIARSIFRGITRSLDKVHQITSGLWNYQISQNSLEPAL